MITSKQIVDIIRKEKDKASESAAIQAYDNIINRIEVYEDIEMTNRYSSFGSRDKQGSNVELDKVFK
jgi:hypothetical protein